MSRLVERRVIGCPYYRAQRYLEQAVGGVAGKAKRTLTLGVSGPGFEISKNVQVSFSPSNPAHYDRPWRLHWKPQSGPYPEFDGELTVRADETYATSVLELQGSYSPPGGVLGAVFDWAAGSRIAGATARDLLRRIGDWIEASYQGDRQPEKDSAANQPLSETE